MRHFNTKKFISCKRNSGFSLVEILVTVAVLSLVLTALMKVLTYTTTSDSQARSKAAASDLMQAGLDYFRKEREILGWQTLHDILQTEAGTGQTTFCLDSAVITQSSESELNNVFDDIDPDGGSCTYSISATGVAANFKRVATVDLSGTDEISVQTTVSWLKENGDPTSITSTQVLKNY